MLGRRGLAATCRRVARTRIGGGPGSRQQATTTGFDGDTAKLYARIAAQHAQPNGPWPAMLRAVQDLALPPGGSLLDLATGPGEPAITIAAAMPHLAVVATDVSEDMVRTATARAEAAGVGDTMRTQLANMDELPFEDESFDVVTCCYGYMFPDDKARACAETFRVLKPGGVAVAATWNRLAVLGVVRSVMRAVLGHEPPPPPLNPMSLAEPGLFNGLLADAGFVDVTSTTSSYPFDFGTDPEEQFKLSVLLVQDAIDELGAEEQARAAFWDTVGEFGTIDPVDGRLVLGDNEFQLVVARKPEA